MKYQSLLSVTCTFNPTPLSTWHSLYHIQPARAMSSSNSDKKKPDDQQQQQQPQKPLFKRPVTILRAVKSQVFDESPQPTEPEVTETSSIGQSKKKTSWAFWSQEPTNQTPKPTGSSSPSLKDARPLSSDTNDKTIGSSTVPNQNSGLSQENLGSDNVKKMIVNGEEKTIETAGSQSKERTQSWSFWSNSSNTTANNNTTKPFNSSALGNPNINIVMGGLTTTNNAPEQDAVLSEPSKTIQSDKIANSHQSTTTTATTPAHPKSKKQKLAPRPNKIVPSVEISLPQSTVSTKLLSSFNKLKSAVGLLHTKESGTHLYRKETATPFKRVLIIGVHGFFPTRMIRPLIGVPKGTSMRFAQVAESAILAWSKENNLNIEIQKIALEKEGKIFDRVEFFFEVLKKWEEELRQSDFIYVCAHSQGAPVSIILISKLLEYGIIDEHKKISILGMAGINIGPFYGMDQSILMRAYSTIENESMLELFQFQNFDSLQSRKYLESLRNLMIHNVRITFVGSVDDQLVPLYSSIASHVSHPSIFRAVYIDGESNTPDFVTRIVKLSCMLQNLGFSDHGVVKEISYALAGPLTGGGHSKIYNDPNVYKVALDFALKTSDPGLVPYYSDGVAKIPVKFKNFDVKAVSGNPFNLPWCARGLFFDVKRKIKDGENEIDMVFREFDDWNPDSKVLKDVKYRLSGIKAKM